MGNIQSIFYFIPELIIVGTVLLAVLVDLIVSDRNVQKVGYLVIAGLTISSFFLWLSPPDQTTNLFLNTIVIDPFSRIFKFIFLLATLIVVMMSMKTDELKSVRTGEYYALMAVMVLGMFLMASSIDLIMIYLAIEVVSITSFILAGYLKDKVTSNEASLKYVIYGAFSSGIMLYGFSLLYGLTGTMKLLELGNAVAALGSESNLALTIATIMIMAGFGYKIAIVPFHFWTPDVYEGSPAPVTAYLSVAPKAAGFALLIRFFNSTFAIEEPFNSQVWKSIAGVPWQDILMIISAITMTVGNLIAIQQNNITDCLLVSRIIETTAIGTNMSFQLKSDSYFKSGYGLVKEDLFIHWDDVPWLESSFTPISSIEYITPTSGSSSELMTSQGNMFFDYEIIDVEDFENIEDFNYSPFKVTHTLGVQRIEYPLNY